VAAAKKARRFARDRDHDRVVSLAACFPTVDAVEALLSAIARLQDVLGLAES
jgi:hypothetical protein